MLILILAANTSFADFPRLSYFLARDGFIPRQFAHPRRPARLLQRHPHPRRHRRRARHRLRRRDARADPALRARRLRLVHALPGEHGAALARAARGRAGGGAAWLNAVGAATTGVVMLVIGVTKFADGAWIVVAADPDPRRSSSSWSIATTRTSLASSRSRATRGPPPIEHTVLVLVGDLHKGVAAALALRAGAIAVRSRPSTSSSTPIGRARLEEKWGKYGLGIPLVVLTSPYRSLLAPFLDYVNHLLALGAEPRGDDRASPSSSPPAGGSTCSTTRRRS